MKYYIGLEGKDFQKNKKWLRSALMHLVEKDFQSWIQKFYFKLRNSKPSKSELREVFSRPLTVNALVLKDYEIFKVYEVSSGFFERVLFTEDQVVSGPKNTLVFMKIDAKGNVTIVDQKSAVDIKNKLKKVLRLK